MIWIKEVRGFKVIISKFVLFNEEIFPCLGDKTVEEIKDNDFVIIEIDFKN